MENGKSAILNLTVSIVDQQSPIVMLAIVMTKLLNDIFQCENLNPWFCG
jgi:hypothetical protein